MYVIVQNCNITKDTRDWTRERIEKLSFELF